MEINSIKSIRTFDVLKISLPMMISALSAHLMLVLDQLILARYSIDAMTGASCAAVWCAALQYAAMSITMVTGAFVGNYNGAKKEIFAGVPTWQMIWFSLSLFVISIPLSMYIGPFCIPENIQTEGIPYFKILMFATPLAGIHYTLSSFFMAIGKGFLVTLSVFVSFLVNLAVDLVLVFGLFGFDSFKGSQGAAIGTICAWIADLIILLFYFLRKDIKKKYGTSNFKLNLKKMKKYLKLGVIGGTGHIFEMLAWSFIYYTLATKGKEIAMIQSIAVSVNTLLAFTVSGLEKGIMSITSNLLGANLKHKTKDLIKKGITIHFTFTLLLSSLIIFYPEVITSNFIKFDVSNEIYQETFLVLRLVLLYFLIDGIVWIIAGVIEGGGDFNFTMVTISTVIWIVVATPTFILSKLDILKIEFTWIMLILAVASTSIILYHRFKSEKWIHIKV